MTFYDMFIGVLDAMLSSQRLHINSICSSVFVVILIFSVGFNIRFYLNDRAEEVVSSAPEPHHTFPPPFIEESLDKTRSKIKYQFVSYNFSFSGARGLEDLVMELGGKPLQTIIMSTWKSGSKFFGQLFNSVPGTYYHFEPLISYGIRRIRSIPEANRSLTIVKNLLNCNYEGLLQDYFKFGRKNLGFFGQNKRLWEHCKINKTLCDDAPFMSRLCKLFPFQTMKIVRLRLQLLTKILDDQELNVKVILLVRDPRGVMQSRQHRNFYQKSPECLTAPVVCADMVSDFAAAGEILQLYPGRLMVLRYEELAMNPYVISHQILKFLKISNKQSSDSAFDQRNTKMEMKDHDLRSNYRRFRDAAFKWQKTLNFRAVNDIQMACKKAMLLWGYRMAFNEKHLKSKHFNPTANISTLLFQYSTAEDY